MKRPSIFLSIACATLAGLSACSSATGPERNPERERWRARGIHDYQFEVVARYGFGGMPPHEITVHADTIISIRDVGSADITPRSEWWRYGETHTIDGLFDLIDTCRASVDPGFDVRVTYNPIFDYPDTIYTSLIQTGPLFMSDASDEIVVLSLRPLK